ncbi:hypothetical protein O1611_g9948 [Lasiodiplodia mahajangana]|uniref:Uncharacterized protein n=1 Tax=Lasiodiplodia mahajangana TaxID=1108764 RepID=A0ACC2J3L2_9PEZI|nr:hypothetical protein O1611_g9948 [Lasiodiplodia mahajangana]
MPHFNLVTQACQLALSHSTITYATIAILAVALFLRLVYYLVLPRPIPGIPYNASSAKKILGDVPAMISHITHNEGTFVTYLLDTVQSLSSPLVQVFITPLGRPLVVLADFREAQEVLGGRGRDFDRSRSLGDLVRGIGPDHHVLLKTNEAWKAQRRLIQDLMTPSFLNKVAGPAMHQSMMVLLDLWREKCRIADGRPWDARDDINWKTLDAVHAFSYGGDFGHSASRPTLERIKGLSQTAIDALRSTGNQDTPVAFPKGEVDDLIKATITLSHTTKEVHGSPMPSLHWAYIMRKPRIRKATKIKETYLVNEIASAIRRLEENKTQTDTSALDHMIAREKKLAQKEGRRPDYYSRVMMDEVCPLLPFKRKPTR